MNFLLATSASHLIGEQGSDVVEELQLLLQGVTALLRHVHDVQDRRAQVSQSRDGLHLDGVPLLQRVVQDTGGVHHLHTVKVHMRQTAEGCLLPHFYQLTVKRVRSG